MRILHSLPKSNSYFQHDAPVLRIVKICLPAFILISSLTVFMGVKAHLQDYLMDTHWLIGNATYGLAYLLFSLAPDCLNVVLLAYFVRTLLKGLYRDRLGVVLLVGAGLMVVALTRYSYRMSQNAAQSLARDVAPKAVLQDLSPIDSMYNEQVVSKTTRYEQEKLAIKQRYQSLIAASTAPFNAQIQPLQRQINQFEKSRSPNNTFYIDLQIKKARKQLAPIEQQVLQLEKQLVEQQNAELLTLSEAHQAALAATQKQKESDRSAAQLFNTQERNTLSNLSQIFSQQLSWIAGYAVFIVLLLALIREILHYRNGIEVQPIISPFDFQTAPMQEVVLLPIITAGRHLINWVRQQYERLPELKAPPTAPALQAYEINQLNDRQTTIERPSDDSLRLSSEGYEDFFQDLEILKENNPYDFRRTDEKVLIVNRQDLKKCAYCEEGFVPNHKKQVYCCSDHRKAAWEKRNGKKLVLKRKK